MLELHLAIGDSVEAHVELDVEGVGEVDRHLVLGAAVQGDVYGRVEGPRLLHLAHREEEEEEIATLEDEEEITTLEEEEEVATPAHLDVAADGVVVGDVDGVAVGAGLADGHLHTGSLVVGAVCLLILGLVQAVI